jgi:hypothetical protein
MLQIFRDVTRERYRRQGEIGIVFWWCRTLLDLTLTVIEQRRRTKLTMSKSTLTQLAGTLLVLGGVFVALAAFSQLQPGDDATSTGIYQVLSWLACPGFLFIGLGCIGLGLRYDRASGMLEQWSLSLSGFGAMVIGVGIFAAIIDSSLRSIAVGGIIIHAIGLTAFGVLHARRPTLPIFRGLPLQMAGGLLVLASGVLQTNSEFFNNALLFLLVVGMGLAWIVIGLTLQRLQQAAPLAAV